MNKKLSKIFAFALSSAMGMAMAAPTLFANATNAKTDDGTVTGSKTLKSINLTEAVDFTFTLAGASEGELSAIKGDIASSANMAYFSGIMEGVKGDEYKDGTVTLNFDPTQDTAFIPNGGEDGYKYYRETFNLDFSEVKWKNGAGVYVYTITEDVAKGYKLATGDGGYKIYVYVENDLDGSGDIKDTDQDGDPDVKIGGIIITDEDGDKSGAGGDDDDTDDYIPDPTNPDNPGTEGGATPTIDSKGDFEFVNENDVSALNVSKKVKGNQASTTQKFEYTLTITGGVDDGTEIFIPGGTPEKIIYSSSSDENTATFQLSHGESIDISMPDGAKWTIDEAVAGYTASAKLDGVDKSDEVDGDDEYTVSGVMGADGQALAYVNELSGTIPTGVLLTVAPFAALTLAGIGGAVVVFKKKKNEDEE